MRKQKYRGQHIDTKEWVYGDGIVWIGDDYCAIPQTLNVTSKDYQIKLVKVNPETAGQFTGFSDNYRRYIYHHDLLHSGQGNLFEVLWHEQDCYWFLNCLTGSHQGPCELKRYMEENLEVIGNIYQHPELLTPAK